MTETMHKEEICGENSKLSLEDLDQISGGFDFESVFNFVTEQIKHTWNELTCDHEPGAFLYAENVKNKKTDGYFLFRHYLCRKCGGEFCTTEDVLTPSL